MFTQGETREREKRETKATSTRVEGSEARFVLKWCANDKNETLGTGLIWLQLIISHDTATKRWDMLTYIRMVREINIMSGVTRLM